MVYRNFKYVLGLLVISFVIFAAFIFSNRITLNFHQVLAQQAYRSRQLDYPELKALELGYHFNSIINLRGVYPKSSWYKAETQLTHEMHLHHYDFSLPAHKLPSWLDLSRLVQAIMQAPKPMLLHCREGADRTGLASAIALLLAGGSKQQVKRQISWHYNVMSPRTIGYQVMQNYFSWLQQSHQNFGRESFLKWVQLKPKMKPQFGWYL